MQAALPLEEGLLSDWLKTHIAPDAERLDYDARLLSDRWEAFSRLGLHELGSSRRNADLFEVLPMAAKVSGAFALLLSQQMVANRSLVIGESDAWPRAGLALEALRKPAPDGLQLRDGHLHGAVPMVLAPGMFEYLLVGFSTEDGEEAVTWLPADDRPGFRLKHAGELAAAGSLRFQSIHVESLELDEAAMTRLGPPGTYATRESKGIIERSPLLLGNLEASVDLLEASGNAAPQARKLVHELWTRATRLRDGTPNGEARQFVAELSLAAIRVAALAVAKSGGHFRTSPAQRVYREAMVFSSLNADEPLLNALESQAFA